MNIISRRLAIAAVLALAACSPKPETPPGVKVDAPWIRATQPSAKAAAGYVTLTNTGSKPDRLVSVASPAAAMAHVHESYKQDGMAKMRAVHELVLLPGEAVTLAPGGYHIMFIDLAAPMAAGERALVSLTFEQAGTVTVPFAVTDAAPAGGEHHAR